MGEKLVLSLISEALVKTRGAVYMLFDHNERLATEIDFLIRTIQRAVEDRWREIEREERRTKRAA
jgi:hypothetical protein